MAEAQVAEVLALHVETVGVLELPLISIRGAVEEQRRRTLGESGAVKLDLPRDVAGLNG